MFALDSYLMSFLCGVDQSYVDYKISSWSWGQKVALQSQSLHPLPRSIAFIQVITRPVITDSQHNAIQSFRLAIL